MYQSKYESKRFLHDVNCESVTYWATLGLKVSTQPGEKKKHSTNVVQVVTKRAWGREHIFETPDLSFGERRAVPIISNTRSIFLYLYQVIHFNAATVGRTDLKVDSPDCVDCLKFHPC